LAFGLPKKKINWKSKSLKEKSLHMGLLVINDKWQGGFWIPELTPLTSLQYESRHVVLDYMRIRASHT